MGGNSVVESSVYVVRVIIAFALLIGLIGWKLTR
jgi:hypothetical protein